MAIDANIQRIKFYRSNTAGAVPAANSLDEGELAINLKDKLIFSKSNNSIVNLSLNKGGQIDGDLSVTGSVTISKALNVSGGLSGDLTGNSTSASKLQLGRNINLSGAVSGIGYFDGTSDITISSTINSSEIGTDWKTNFRGTLGENTSSSNFLDVIRSENSANTLGRYGVGLGFGKSDTHGLFYLNYNTASMTVGAGNANKILWSKQVAFTDSDITGNASTANKLQLGRYFNITGGVNSSKLFDGGGDVTFDLGTYWNGNSATANKWITSRTITIAGNGFSASGSIDGSSNLTMTPVFTTQSTTTSNTTVATTAFVQNVNTAETGASAYALKLKTARKINTINFDGTGDIRVPIATFDAVSNVTDVSWNALSGIYKAGDYSLAQFNSSAGNTPSMQFAGLNDNSLLFRASGSSGFNNAFTKIVTESSGTAQLANQLTTARKIELNNSASGSAYFDGSNDIYINVTSLDATKLKGIANISGIKSTTGSFYFDSSSNSAKAGMRLFLSDNEFNVWNFSATKNVLSVNSNNVINCIGKINSTGGASFSGTIQGNIETADKLNTGRKIQGVIFDGSADITLPTASTSILGLTQIVDDLKVTDRNKPISANCANWLYTNKASKTESNQYTKTPNSEFDYNDYPIRLENGAWAGGLAFINTGISTFGIQNKSNMLKVSCNGNDLYSFSSWGDFIAPNNVWTGSGANLQIATFNTFGPSQSHQYPDRSANVTYTNDTSRPIAVWIMWGQQGGSEIRLFLNGNVTSKGQQDGVSGGGTLFCIVPPGSNYRVDGGNQIQAWSEYR